MSRLKAVALSFAGLMAVSITLPAMAREHALVVGINDYVHFLPPGMAKGGQHTDLQGAANDAEVIARALRNRAVSLPDDRILIDRDATLANFRAAWDRMVQDAQPGDTLIITYAGHGGQEREVSEPFDEKDNLDETLMFSDFDPENTRQGRLNDDQLRELLGQYPQFRILLVMDSCHSAGLERSITPGMGGLKRSSGIFDIPIDPLPDEAPSGEGETEAPPLPNVTQIFATATEDRLVQETVFENRPHGALSWFFARALEGDADANGDGALSGQELSTFLGDRVFTAMEQNQQPRFLPRGDSRPMLGQPATPNNAPDFKPKPKPLAEEVLQVRVMGEAPDDLASGACPSCTLVDDNAALTFQKAAVGWHVFNGVGDRIGHTMGRASPHIQRALFLRDLNSAKRSDVPPVVIEPMQSAARQRIGQRVGFRFAAPDNGHSFITLFNVASDGEVQYPLYQRGFRPDKPVQGDVTLQFDVAPPTGEDQLVAIWCTRPPVALANSLEAMAGSTVPSMTEFLKLTDDNDCQYGRIGLYTED